MAGSIVIFSLSYSAFPTLQRCAAKIKQDPKMLHYAQLSIKQVQT